MALQRLMELWSTMPIHMIDLMGGSLAGNPGRRLKGYAASEIIGRPFTCFFTLRIRRPRLPKKVLETTAAVGRFETEGWRVRSDGTRFWALGVVDAIKDENGQLIGFAKVTRDMTERQREQTRLLESERRFRHLINAVVDYAIFQFDRNGIVATWNPGAERAKGYAAEDIIGQHFSRFYTDEDRAAGLPQRALETAASEGRFEAEGWPVRRRWHALLGFGRDRCDPR